MGFTADARMHVRITPDDVGRRVSVRRLSEAPAAGARYTDTVGELTSWVSGVLSITRRDGVSVSISQDALVAGKVIPPTPPRRRTPKVSTTDLERVAARGWPPMESERLGAWTLRAADGFTRRANSALALGDPGADLGTAVSAVARWYAERGLPPYLVVQDGATGPAGEDLDAALAARGWTREAPAVLLTAPLAPLPDTVDPHELDRVRLSREPDAEWLALYHHSAQASPAALRVLSGGPSVWCAKLPAPDGTTAAIGRLVVDGPPWSTTGPGTARWAGFAAIEVAPAHRRRGLATLVMAALAHRALAEGASAGYLQVEADNEGAWAMYERLGFTEHHRYHYRRGPVAGSA
ncbi:GNAT family N-acetyltransferase [Streptomyces sp. NPDC059740]|uniref:GNAT family N-acetyltransferase n=1 Tax=Streptomyces sp. NPDC059740 TaxID=3346926 RepID=UPI00364BDEB8